MENVKGRMEYLDGIRGLAILLVISFHAYARWPELVPYGNDYGNFLLFKYGSLGVQLFFLISGFVILMTLEKCSTAKVFLYRRWLRLFPAMLVCSVAIFLTSPFFFERPAGIPGFENLLPGLTFVEPLWWTWVLGHPISSMEGAFWSLYVEFKFYVFSAIIYYWKGRNSLILSLMLAFAASLLLRATGGLIESKSVGLLFFIFSTMSFKYFGWFASGAAFYVFSKNRSPKWLTIAICAAIASAVAEGGFDWEKTVAACGVSIFFAAAVAFEGVKKYLGNRCTLFFGAISYPLYLIHENAMVSIIIKLDRNTDFIQGGLLPIPAIIILSIVALFVHGYCEPFVKSVIVKAQNMRLPR